ncbi:DUF362 domain-containing protein [candidate division WOR-3 bacterium]|nr:DUF362 domain-containing protein [candidate division WOR-3 bacterium]
MSEGPRARVLVHSSADLNAATNAAFDFLEHDFSGQRVWVKPNLIGPFPPGRGATTDPELVRRMVGSLRARGAAEVWVADNPGGWLRGSVETYLAPTGIVEASDGCFRNIAETPVTLPVRSRFIKEVRVSRILHEADVVINVPVLKTHALTLLSGAVKNLFGVIPGQLKAEMHTAVRNSTEFAELLVDLFQALPANILHVMDAQRGMDGQNGPTGGRTLAIGRLLASRNAVALDSVMALLCGIEPARVPFLRIAGERGLGPVRRADIDITGDITPVPGFRLPSPLLAGALTGIIARAYPLARSEPLLARERCIRCGRCANGCPAGAIVLDPWPRIDDRRCINCYCCAEVCPRHALVVPGPVRGFIHRLTGW